MDKIKDILLISKIIIGILSLIIVGFFLRQKSTGNKSLPVVIKTDTVTIIKTDTIREVKPVLVSKTIKQVDTIYVRDTIAVPVPVSQNYYRGADYEAWISGYKPNLDSLNIFHSTEVRYVTKTEIIREKAKKWGIGVQAGYGWNGEKFTPYIGAGVTYTFLRF